MIDAIIYILAGYGITDMIIKFIEWLSEPPKTKEDKDL